MVKPALSVFPYRPDAKGQFFPIILIKLSYKKKGVGGHIKGYLHKLDIEAAGRKFVCPIVFSREYLASFNLIGRQEFFRRFKIIFEESKNLLTLK